MSKGKFIIPLLVILLLIVLAMLWINFRIGSVPKFPSVPSPISGGSSERKVAPGVPVEGEGVAPSVPSAPSTETKPATGTTTTDSKELDDLQKSVDELQKFLESQKSEKDLDDSGVGIQ